MNTATTLNSIVLANSLEEAKALVASATGQFIVKLADPNLGREHMEEVFALMNEAKTKGIGLLYDEAAFLETTAERHVRMELSLRQNRKSNSASGISTPNKPYYRQFDKHRF